MDGNATQIKAIKLQEMKKHRKTQLTMISITKKVKAFLLTLKIGLSGVDFQWI